MAALLAVGVFAGSASAILVKLPHGGYANYDSMMGKKEPRAARIFDQQFTNLDYSGGPVMPSNRNYTIVWQPSNYAGTAFQSGYTSGVNTFFTDMAADSGQHTNSDSVSTQYNDVNGNTAAYQSSNGGLYTDTDPLPPNGCPANTGDICITDAQIQTELDSFLGGKGLPHDMAHEYYLLTPPDVASCFDSWGTSCSGNADQKKVWCAYHSSSAAGYIYANIPDLTGLPGCDPFVTSCPTVRCRYNNGPADGVLSAISHEHNESITDPQPNNAWTDWGSTVGGEIGDKCNNDGMTDPNLKFGGPNGNSPYNEIVNGDDYLLQAEWSNQGTQCLDSFTTNGTVAHASFTSSPSSGLTVNLNAVGSAATGGVKYYVWQFNDGPGQTGTVETTSSTISHTFATPGNAYVALTVMANDGTSNGTAKTVPVGRGGIPSAAFIFSPSMAVEGSSLAFDGSSSTDPGGTIGSYAWKFGDGGTATGKTASHTYTHYGTYTASLTITDSGNQKQSTITHTVTVTDEGPIAAFSVSPSSPTAGSPAQFTGSGSDPDGSISNYSWNFGDGGTGNGATASHTYAARGFYTVTLTVTDSDGQTATSQHGISVSPSGGTPSAAFTVSPGTAVEGTSFGFDGSSSADQGGTIGSYAWTFGDGQTGTGRTTSHTYARYGTYTASLTVTDAVNQKPSTTTHTVTVTDEGPNATFVVSSSSPTAGSPALFIGGGSDPDGAISSYSWNFGDGATGTGAMPAHTYSAAGFYTVTLTITDSDGQAATVQHGVSVGAPPPPIAAFSFSPGTPDTNTVVSFNGSSSSQAGGSIAQYRWTFGDGTSGNGATVSHTFGTAGTYTVTLTVTATTGQAATTSRQITVSPGSHGPRTACTVPKLKGKTLSQARGALGAGHCSLGKVSKPAHAPRGSAGHGKKWELVVASQSPGGGKSLAKGARVGVKLTYKAVKSH